MRVGLVRLIFREEVSAKSHSRETLLRKIRGKGVNLPKALLFTASNSLFSPKFRGYSLLLAMMTTRTKDPNTLVNADPINNIPICAKRHLDGIHFTTRKS